MIHYHGLPITPGTAALAAISGGHAFVSFRYPDQLAIAVETAQSFAVDNGAFSAWKSGHPVTDWRPYYDWVYSIYRTPSFDWAVIPDVIDGDEKANDALLAEWPWHGLGVPVWHMHESVDRLVRLAYEYSRIAIGSSGTFSVVGSPDWWRKMSQAMDAICSDGQPVTKLHGLRMLNPKIFSKLPLSSADSTNIARNIGIDSAWRGSYTPLSKDVRATVMRTRIESVNGAAKWNSGDAYTLA